MSERLVVDMERCEGHALCLLMAPGLVRLDRWGYPVVSDRPLASPGDRRGARRARRGCPRGALRLESATEDRS